MITADSLLKEWKAGYKDNVKTVLEGIEDKQARMTLTAELYAKLSTDEGERFLEFMLGQKNVIHNQKTMGE